MRRFFLLLTLLFIALTFFSFPAVAPAAPAPAGFQNEDAPLPAILLKARTIQPVRGVDAASRPALDRAATEADPVGYHALVQLEETPDADARAALAQAGIHLQAYLPHQAWVALIEPAQAPTAEAALARPEVAWIGALLPDDKIDPDLAARSRTPEAFAATDQHLVLYLTLHEDVSLAKGRELLAPHFLAVLGEEPLLNTLIVGTTVDHLPALAAAEAVLWLEEALPPLTEVNDNSRAVLNVDDVDTTYGLDGTGIDVLIFDAGVASHNDYNARRLDTDGSGNSDHATHVAGTVLGDGSGDPTAEGMAPGAEFISYGYEADWWGYLLFREILYTNLGDTKEDWDDALDDYGADLGTASLGSNIERNNYSCGLMGNYNSMSRLLDEIVRGALGKPYITVWAAGNDRNGSDCSANYGSLAPPASAKNPIQVCATNSAGTSPASFSGFGPTDDGRLKPVVCAPGVGVYSTVSGNSYGTKSGTSMATPAVSGVVALMLEAFRDQYNTTEWLLPASVKAILINSADDFNSATLPGPDFQTGYGMVDALAAVDTVLENRFREGYLATGGDQIEYRVQVQSGDPLLQVSLAWDDPRGAPLAGRELVNDLDLRLIDPDGATHRPWLLNAGNPASAATTGIDDRNNMEQVTVANPAAGWWTVRVSAADLPSPPQRYGIAATHNMWTFNLEAPTEAQPGDAGYFAGPDKMVIRLYLSDGYRPSTNITAMDPATDLTLAFGSQVLGPDGGAILRSYPAGNEFHLVVRPPAQSGPDLYDLEVAYLGGFLADREARAVLYGSTPSDPKALSLVIDNSGSMDRDGKMGAAKTAARDFIFISDVGDAIAQTWFNTTAATFQPLAEVTAESDLDTFSANLSPLSAGGWTALGQGAALGYSEIALDARVQNMVLLSDGRENREPLWDTVKESIPRNVTIHTVALGPDADVPFLQAIASRHDGDMQHVRSGPDTAAPAAIGAAGDASVASSLPNRLADAYQFLADEVHDYERHRESSATFSSGATHNVNFTLSESVPWIFFTVNWDNAGANVQLNLYRPGNVLVSPADADAEYRDDVTNIRYRIASPGTGTWRMEIKHNGGPQTEYLATVEGPADTDLIFFTPRLGECRPTVQERICGGLVDGEGYVAGSQSIWLQVPGNQEVEMIEVKDGYYCSEPLLFPEGPTSVKMTASGTTRKGDPLARVDRQSFYCGDLETPPVLLVNDDDERQENVYTERDTYITALTNLGVDHDVWNTETDGPPLTANLAPYRVVIWLTADDNYVDGSTGRGTLDPDEAVAVTGYLKEEAGNIFALSSSGYLNAYGFTSFAQEVLGLAGVDLDHASSSVRGIRDTALGHEFGPYAFSSSVGDELRPGGLTDVALVNNLAEPLGVTHGYGQGCSAFFSFGLENLPASGLEEMLSRIVAWECAPVDIAVDTAGFDNAPALLYGARHTETFTVTNTIGDGGPLDVELNNGPTHLWLLADSSGGVPSLLAPYHLGDLGSPLAPAAVTAFDVDASVSRLCVISSGLGDCCSGGSCSEAMLLDNDVAIVWNNTPFADPDALGNMLADFVDGGGTVLLGGNALIPGANGIGGRFAEAGYAPIWGDTAVGAAALGSIDTPGHPLVAGLGAVSTSDHLKVDTTGGTGVTVHATWDSGYPLLASRVLQPGTGGQIVAINASFENGTWSGDLDLLVDNALALLDQSWRAPGWFSPVCSTTPPAETAPPPPLVYNPAAGCPLIQGGVSWVMGLRYDAFFPPPADIPPGATTLSYQGKIAIAHNVMGTERINIPISLQIDVSYAPPFTPTVAISSTATGISLTWPALAQDEFGNPLVVHAYRIYRSDSPYGGGTPQMLAEVTRPATSFQDDGAHGDLNSYFYYVVAVSAAGTPSDPSPEVGKIPFVLVPGG